MKNDKSMGNMLRALPEIWGSEGARRLGRTVLKQWGGARGVRRVLVKGMKKDGVLRNLNDLRKFKIGRITGNLIVSLWETFPDREAIVDGDTRLTFRDLRDRVFRLANALQAAGIEPKDRVAVMLNNSTEFIEVFMACCFIGAITPMLNWHLEGKELQETINLSKPRFLIYENDYASQIEAVREGLEGSPQLVVVGGEEPGDGIIGYEDLLRGSAATPPKINFIVGFNPYTGGTTGLPKSVNLYDGFSYMLSDLAERPRIPFKSYLQRNLTTFGYWGWFGAGEIEDPISKNIRSIVPTPMYHAGTFAAWSPIVFFAGTIVPMRKFDEEEFLRLIEKERISWTFVAPTILQRVLALPEEVKRKYNLSSMHALICAAAPCPPDVKCNINELFMRQGAETPVFYEYYGSSESSVITILCPVDYVEKPDRYRSVGKPRLGELAIYIADDDRWGKPGEVGRVLIQSVSTSSLRYEGAEQKLKDSVIIIDGVEWFDDGLLGYQDEDGFLYLTGREKEMIITGGVNIYPLEIETIILKHPAVLDAAVIRYPDEDLGEVALAAIQLHKGAEATAEDIIAFCREEGLYGFKLPTKVEFFEELPRHIDGKLLKREIEKLYWKEIQARG